MSQDSPPRMKTAGLFSAEYPGLNEKPGKCLQRGRNAGEHLSSCHLTKQRLINSLGVEVHESAGLLDGDQSALPYKISRFLQGSLESKLGVGSTFTPELPSA
jgi:hypothetical protein